MIQIHRILAIASHFRIFVSQVLNFRVCFLLRRYLILELKVLPFCNYSLICIHISDRCRGLLCMPLMVNIFRTTIFFFSSFFYGYLRLIVRIEKEEKPCQFKK